MWKTITTQLIQSQDFPGYALWRDSFTANELPNQTAKGLKWFKTHFDKTYDLACRTLGVIPVNAHSNPRNPVRSASNPLPTTGPNKIDMDEEDQQAQMANDKQFSKADLHTQIRHACSSTQQSQYARIHLLLLKSLLLCTTLAKQHLPRPALYY
jgi:hypothetical protein